MAIRVSPKEVAAGQLDPTLPGLRKLVVAKAKRTAAKPGKRSSAMPRPQKSRAKPAEKPAKQPVRTRTTIETALAELEKNRRPRVPVTLRLNADALDQFQAAAGSKWRAVLALLADVAMENALVNMVSRPEASE